MKRIYLTIIAFSPLLFTACSPQELFSNLATSDVERSAAETVAQSDALKKKINTIETNKKTFSQTAELGLVRPDLEAAAFAFRNNFAADQKTIIVIEALLPDATNKFYEAWLTDDADETPMSLGALTYHGPQDYQLIFETNTDTTNLSKIMITTETIADDQPEDRVFIGTFTSRANGN